MTFQPLSVRHNNDEVQERYAALHEGVPAWLVGPLAKWVEAALEEPYPSDFLRAAEQVALRLRIRVPENQHPSDVLVAIVWRAGKADAEQALDIVDSALALTPSSRPRWLAGQLEQVLRTGGSAWTVGTHNGMHVLTRRVEKTAGRRASEVMQVASSASDHMAQAWHALYGREPSPTEAISQAVKAVEAAARPTVTPADEKTTLGKMITAMADKLEKWELALTGTGRKQRPGIQVVIDMMEVLWTSQHDRHGDNRKKPPMTQQEAEAAVHLALTLTHWFQAGLVERTDAGAMS